MFLFIQRLEQYQLNITSNIKLTLLLIIFFMNLVKSFEFALKNEDVLSKVLPILKFIN